MGIFYFLHAYCKTKYSISKVEKTRRGTKREFLTYHCAAASDDVAETLQIELGRIANDLLALYRTELSGVDRSMIPDAAESIDIDAIGSRISDSARTIGKEQLLMRITPYAVKYVMHSDSLGIAGSPDKLVRIKGCVLPYIIRTGNKPDQEVWKPDRLQIAAYAILVEETFDQVVEYGFVEYARFFEMREVNIRHRDRRKVLELRNRIRMIRDGRMPDRPRDAPCDLCTFNEECITQQSLASKFF